MKLASSLTIIHQVHSTFKHIRTQGLPCLSVLAHSTSAGCKSLFLPLRHSNRTAFSQTFSQGSSHPALIFQRLPSCLVIRTPRTSLVSTAAPFPLMHCFSAPFPRRFQARLRVQAYAVPSLRTLLPQIPAQLPPSSSATLPLPPGTPISSVFVHLTHNFTCLLPLSLH